MHSLIVYPLPGCVALLSTYRLFQCFQEQANVSMDISHTSTSPTFAEDIVSFFMLNKVKKHFNTAGRRELENSSAATQDPDINHSKGLIVMQLKISTARRLHTCGTMYDACILGRVV